MSKVEKDVSGCEFLKNLKVGDKCQIYDEVRSEYFWYGTVVHYKGWIEAKVIRINDDNADVCRYDPDSDRYRHETIRIVLEDRLIKPV